MFADGETSIPLTTPSTGEQYRKLCSPKLKRLCIRDEICSHQILRTSLLTSQGSGGASQLIVLSLRTFSTQNIITITRIIRKEGIGISETLSPSYRIFQMSCRQHTAQMLAACTTFS